VLDEPTAQLEAREIERLFERMAQLQARGVGFLYISHHLAEIFDTCQTVTVLRDGRLITTAAVRDLGKDDLVRAMVGDAIAETGASDAASDDTAAGAVRLSVRDLTVRGACTGVDLEVHAGERVGLAGLAGSGKAEVAAAIVGLIKPDRCQVLVDDRRLRPGRVDLSIARGIGYVPEDRHASGLAPNLSVEENLTLPVLGRLGPAGVVDPRRRRSRARRLLTALGIVASSPKQLVSELSGGNQQKTVMGRALSADPRALILVNPTAGVDIASKAALYETIRTTPDVGVLVVSDELDELAICDRVLVMFEGEVVREFPRGWAEDDLVATMEGVGAR
jgi:simple sugar transport system ATP-binding protein